MRARDSWWSGPGNRAGANEANTTAVAIAKVTATRMPSRSSARMQSGYLASPESWQDIRPHPRWKAAGIYLATGLAVAIVSGFIRGRLRLERYLEEWVLEQQAVAAPMDLQLSLGARAWKKVEATRKVVGKTWPYRANGRAPAASAASSESGAVAVQRTCSTISAASRTNEGHRLLKSPSRSAASRPSGEPMSTPSNSRHSSEP